MSSLLKLDGRTVRGRIWKELNTSGKPLKQGILINKKLCTYCNQSPDPESEVINCMSCHSAFHTSCLLKPVSDTFLDLIAENPSIFWFCPDCIGCKTGDYYNDLEIPTSHTDGSNIGSDVIMQRELLSFKRDILKLVGETMDNKFNSLSNLVQKHSAVTNNGKNVAGETNDKNTNRNKTYGEIVSGKPENKSQSPIHQPALISDMSDAKHTRKPEKHVLLLKPNDETSASSESVQKESLNSVYRAVTDVNIEFCSQKKSGMIAIGFPDAASKKLAEEKINKDEACSSVFTTESPKKLLPKVTVKGINEILFDSCDKENRDELKAVLLKDILLRNKDIQSIIDSDSSEFLHVVTIQKVMPSHNHVSYNAVLKMSCKVRNYIYKGGDKLYISFNRCKVTDRFHVTQCYYCQKPGHYSNACNDRKEGKLPTCFYCSGSHASKNCPTKQSEQQEKCCNNCLKSSNPDMVNNAKTHTAASYNCPIIQSYVKNIKGKTENWQEKNFSF